MKFNRLGHNRLQIIISADDLTRRNIKQGDFFPLNHAARQLFGEIIRTAAREYDFAISQDTRLVVEAYPLGIDSFILNLTRIDGREAQVGFEISEVLETLYDVLVDEPAETYRFDTLEDVIVVAEELRGLSVLASSLYKDEGGSYLLRLQIQAEMEEASYGRILEYATPVPFTKAYVQEHAECMIEENALQILQSL